MAEKIEKIVVKAPNWLGDNVFTIPAVQELRIRYPRAHLSILVKSRWASFWELVPGVDGVIPYRARGGLKDFLKKRELLRLLRKEQFDLAIIFPRSFESALWMYLARIPRRWGYAEEGRSWLLTRVKTSVRGYHHTHRSLYYYNLIGAAEECSSRPRSRLAIPSDLASWAREFISRQFGPDEFDCLVGLHPGASYGPAKCWPLPNYAHLVEKLVREEKATVLVFGNAEERELVQMVVEAGEPKVINLAGKTNVKQLAALIRLCRVFVGNDSGPLQLAAALGVPVIGLFGSSDPNTTAPAGGAVRVIYKAVPCSPCLKPVCPTDFKCMNEILPTEVFSKIEELWEKK